MSPPAADQSLRDGPPGLDRSLARLQDGVDVFGANKEVALRSEEMIPGCQATDDDHVRAALRRNRFRYPRENLIGA